MIRPYVKADFSLLQSWVTDADLLLLFAGTEFSYPITEDQIISYQQRMPGRTFYIGCNAEGTPYAFGEIIPQEDNTQRLGRLLIGEPARRGKGLGVAFVKELIAECVRLYNTPRVDLYVWDKNEPAIRCYKRAGFVFADMPPYIMTHNGKEYVLYKMSISTVK